MNTRLINIWYAIRSSLWFLPAILTLLAGFLAIGTLMADQTFKGMAIRVLGPFGTMGPDGARALLSTVAGSVITIDGVAFSITIVALTLASSQFGPRLLRTFLKDTSNQLVLGIFIATFVYFLLVMGAIRDAEHQLFVPIISVFCSLAFALVSMGATMWQSPCAYWKPSRGLPYAQKIVNSTRPFFDMQKWFMRQSSPTWLVKVTRTMLRTGIERY